MGGAIVNNRLERWMRDCDIRDATAQAQADGRQRLVEMNEPVRLNLVRIIEGLEALGGVDAG